MEKGNRINEALVLQGQVYIFGAQSRAKTLKGYLQYLFPGVDISAFLVDDMTGNEMEIDQIPVRVLDSVTGPETPCTVFIATKGIYHEGIQGRLEKKGLNHIIPVTVEVDNRLRNEYVRKYYAQAHMEFIKLTDLPVRRFSAAIYMAESVYDKPLQTKYIRPDYEKAIQVGAALTSRRLSPKILTDCDGENISAKNRQYCELTALYWVWKNAAEDIVGLSHYRRHFVLPDQWQDIMVSNDIDVILPVPTYVQPNIGENYKERHDPADWDFLMEYLKEKRSDDYGTAGQVFSGGLYLPCNMFIMHREILDHLCRWMFPILDAVVANGGEKEDAYQNRYPGFISERLITLYFCRNKSRYRIAYADRNFLQ